MPKQQSIKPNTKEQGDEKPERSQVPAILFDLDGTLLDSAYEHEMAWHEALEEGVAIPSVRVHRCVSMSGKLILRTLFPEIGLKGNSTKIEHLEKPYKKNFEKRLPSIRMLLGARERLRHLSGLGVRWTIATSGNQKNCRQDD
jgi:phosphoglycolate phosphatase-like HAD superfamily hydrolase